MRYYENLGKRTIIILDGEDGDAHTIYTTVYRHFSWKRNRNVLPVVRYQKMWRKVKLCWEDHTYYMQDLVPVDK